jgi:dTDP-4-amino-4,6-dideoxygalactose transaminase
MTIDPTQIEEAITPQTAAIVAVHCYGNTCDTSAIEAIARKHQLRVIYDACHSFGVRDSGGSVLRYGDLSVVSLHATKVFNTFEGGLIVSTSAEQKAVIDNLKNFGFVHEALVNNIGFNGKFSELNAAVGLAQLDYITDVIAVRGLRDELYRHLLSGVEGISLFNPVRQAVRNYSYFPIFVDSSYPLTRDQLCEEMRTKGIFARRYFYPLISEFPPYRDIPSNGSANLPVATMISRQVLCLPLHPQLTEDEVRKICNVVMSESR